jgi:choline dehydrogenase
VIVGAGAAGCVLASKLSEDKNVSVLLLEAGGDNTKVLEAKVPLMFPKLFHTQHDWDYYTVEQPQLSSRRLYWPRGRIMGGSTSLNAMMYHHRAQSDFEQWASVHGCEGWGYDDLATYLRRMEKFTPNPARPPMDVQTHGSSGDWQTGYSWLSEIIEKGFIPACHDAGILANTDVNTREGTLGVVPFQTFIDQKGQRSSLATAFLTPDVLERDNLFVAYHAHVIRVLFDCLTSADPTAIGVEFQTSRGGSLFQVHARREVILCGGAINTAQVLMLSGIGPGNDLMSLGIPVIQKNEAVGRNLKDHLYPTPIICKAKPDKNLDYLSNNVRALLALLQWKLLGRGPLTSNAGEAAAFIRSLDFQFAKSSSGPPKDNTSGPMGPDLEIIGVPLAFNHHSEELVADGSSVLSIVLTHLRPLSVGTISLRSRDASDPRRYCY